MPTFAMQEALSQGLSSRSIPRPARVTEASVPAACATLAPPSSQHVSAPIPVVGGGSFPVQVSAGKVAATTHALAKKDPEKLSVGLNMAATAAIASSGQGKSLEGRGRRPSAHVSAQQAAAGAKFVGQQDPSQMAAAATLIAPVATASQAAEGGETGKAAPARGLAEHPNELAAGVARAASLANSAQVRRRLETREVSRAAQTPPTRAGRPKPMDGMHMDLGAATDPALAVLKGLCNSAGECVLSFVRGR